MQNKVTYEFAIIRLVPKIEREEFINIGVIVFSKRKRYLDMKYLIDEQRIHAFAKDVDILLIQQYTKAWKSICEGHPHGGPIGMQEQPFRYRWIVAPKDTMIQCSSTHPGLCEDPALVLDALFEKFVLQSVK